MFHYSSYWHTWSRVLSTSHPRGPFVEVNLTPINRDWENHVAPVRIRFHGTPPSDRDIVNDALPPEVRASMVHHLGEELTDRLLTEDFLSQINVELYDQFNNGGANLDDIKF